MPYRSLHQEPPRDMTESQRALELRKFFAPVHASDFSIESTFNHTLNNDGALDAYAETLVWRLKAAHAMVSLIDRGTQYFLAGAVRSTCSIAHDVDDAEDKIVTTGQWYGCSTISTRGGLCEHTIAVDIENLEYPCFVVSDLSKDPRFANLPVVNGQLASYRFYAGAPIITSYGVTIGSFFLFDDQVRESLTLDQKKCLSRSTSFLNQLTIPVMHRQAANVMKHLETKREAAERRRGAVMSMGLSTFLEWTSHEDDLFDEITSPVDRNSHDSQKGSVNEDKVSTPLPASENSEKPDQPTTLDQIRVTLDRAAEILKESLELDAGGVVFLDMAVGYAELEDMNDGVDTLAAKEPTAKDLNRDTLMRNGSTSTPSLSVDLRNQRCIPSLPAMRNANGKYKTTKVLAMSAAENAAWDPEANVMDTKSLQSLTKSYPKGNVWYIDEDGYFSSIEQINLLEESSAISPSGRVRSRNTSLDLTRRRAEASMLSRVFVKARQIIFVPLWDAAGDRWYAGCFVWSQTAVPVFTVDSEISYLSAFTNSVMVEISRLDAITSNKMKSDFISSISHEFRSPLHGILASAEFLRDSTLDSSQLEFISTIQNCSGTLLDTINHVLDYSKINSFEKRGNKQGTISNELYQVTNLALLCEDIVNGMMAANEFRASGSEDIALPSSSRFSFNGHNQTLQRRSKKLEIIIDMERTDWVYKVQAGALRRVVMNIFGNAQKYTDSGFIMVQLRMREINENPANRILCVHIRDTGRGMSSEYMERKLYHPFAQEDSFAPGVGLGLSIVWSIVNQLGGRISIKSEVKKGTDVEITIPVEKNNELCSRATTPDQISKVAAEAEEVVKTLRMRASGKSICFLRHETNRTRYKDMSWQCLEKYCSDWFGFTIQESAADILITDEENDPKCSESKGVLVVHEKLASYKKDGTISRPYVYSNVSQPLGPFKLARSLLSLLNQEVDEVPICNGERRGSLTDASTQTPLGTPQERAMVKGMVMSDYGFPTVNAQNLKAHGRQDQAINTTSDSIPQEESWSPKTTQQQIRLQEPPKRKSPPVIPSKPVLLRSSSTGNLQLTTFSIPGTINIPLTPTITPPTVVFPTRKIHISAPSETIITSINLSTPVSTPTSIAVTKGSNKGLTVLAVDDNSLNLQLLHRYLIKRKCDTVVTARNGVEAVAKFKDRKWNFDVVFMDISMPEMDGFEATRLIRSYEKSLEGRAKSACWRSWSRESDCASSCPQKVGDENSKPNFTEKNGVVTKQRESAYIVAVTGLASRRDRDLAVASGFDDFLTKPISFTKIGAFLRHLSEES